MTAASGPAWQTCGVGGAGSEERRLFHLLDVVPGNRGIGGTNCSHPRFFIRIEAEPHYRFTDNTFTWPPNEKNRRTLTGNGVRIQNMDRTVQDALNVQPCKRTRSPFSVLVRTSSSPRSHCRREPYSGPLHQKPTPTTRPSRQRQPKPAPRQA